MLLEKLRELEQSDLYPFHMPGHKRAMCFPNPYAIDITETEGFDNLHHAEGILLKAQEKAARLYGSGRAYYLVNGSTCGILAAVSAAVSWGGDILIARNCHKAVYHAVYLRQLRAKYIYPAETGSGLQGQISPSDIKRKLDENPEIKAVVITSPTYDGIVSDIKAIAEEVHAHSAVLIVDEAHGAHFGFDPYFPENAVVLGADAVIMSVHKTLPAFTQTALLHLCSDRISQETTERFLRIYETSSPSYLLMAGIENCLDIMEKDGGPLFAEYKKNLELFNKKTAGLKHLKVLRRETFSSEEAFDFDRGKLLIDTGGYISGYELQEKLRMCYHLELEMAGGTYVTAMTSVMDTAEGFDRLAEALLKIDSELKYSKKSCQKYIFPKEIYCQRRKRIELHEAYDSPKIVRQLSETIGSVSADFISLYPPGIPIIVPGEIIDKKLVESVLKFDALGYEIDGVKKNDNGILAQILE